MFILTRPIFYILLLFTALLLNTAWIGDDAMISLAQVVNFDAGEGMVINHGERVQSFTHVTWFFLMALVTGITGEYYLTVMLMGIVCTLGALYVAYKYAVDSGVKWAGYLILVLFFCNAFIDYATSGLENSLSYLLFGLMLYMVFLEKVHDEKFFLKLFVLMAFIFLNRMDYAFILVPLTLWYFYHYRWIAIKPALIAGLIPLAWFIFAVFYFGQPFPQPYYAKLGASSLWMYVLMGFYYFFVQLINEPLILFVLFLGILAGIALRSKALMVALGIMFYLLYLIKIGGDFMLGRHFSTIGYMAVFLMVVYATHHQLQPSWTSLKGHITGISYKSLKILVSFAVVIVLGCVVAILLRPVDGFRLNTLGKLQTNKIAWPVIDERGFYNLHQSLVAFVNYQQESSELFTFLKIQPVSNKPHFASKVETLGLASLNSDGSNYLMEYLSLSSPFLSRQKTKSQIFRVGHVARPLPKGFNQAVIEDNYKMPDPVQQYMWEVVKLVTRGDLFDWERIKSIYTFNQIKNYEDAKVLLKVHDLEAYQDYLGYLKQKTQELKVVPSFKETNVISPNKDKIIDFISDFSAFYTFKAQHKNVPLNQVAFSKTLLAIIKPNNTPWTDKNALWLPNTQSLITFDILQQGSSVDISVSNNDGYLFEFKLKNEVVFKQVVKLYKDISTIDKQSGDLESTTIDFKKNIEFDSIRVIPAGGDKLFAVGHLVVNN